MVVAVRSDGLNGQRWYRAISGGISDLFVFRIGEI